MTQAYGKQHSIHNFLYFFEVDVVVRVLQRNRTNTIYIERDKKYRSRYVDIYLYIEMDIYRERDIDKKPRGRLRPYVF